jgi:hypothetical protein
LWGASSGPRPPDPGGHRASTSNPSPPDEPEASCSEWMASEHDVGSHRAAVVAARTMSEAGPGQYECRRQDGRADRREVRKLRCALETAGSHERRVCRSGSVEVPKESVSLDVKRAFPFSLDGRSRPGRTTVSTAVSYVLLTRKRSQVQTLSRPPHNSDQRKRFDLVLRFGRKAAGEHLSVWEAVCGVGISVMVIGSLTSTSSGWLHCQGQDCTADSGLRALNCTRS